MVGSTGALVGLLVPVLYAWGAARRSGDAVARLALAASVAAAAVVAVSGGPGLVGEGALAARLDGLTALVLGLVTLLGAVVVPYASRLLAGDRRVADHRRWLYATLAGASVVVLADHLAVMALGWVGTSLALHRLLVWFHDRPGAVQAAAEKFVVSRLAEVGLFATLAALVLGGAPLSSTALSSVAPTGLWAEVAGVLLVGVLGLKTAQLGAHGWLTRVMEAPTPVSALLHAGVINLGGVVLLRVAPWFDGLVLAPAALGVLGAATAGVGGLVMATRVSVKATLVWSTITQMGFMLWLAGCGAWDLVLLHLIGHALYKAHAFLSAGGAVAAARDTRPDPSAGVPAAVGALVVAVGLAAASSGGGLMAAVGAFVTGLGLAPVVRAGARRPLRAAWAAAALVGAATLAHGLVAPVAAPVGAGGPGVVLAGGGLLFGAFLAHVALRRWPAHPAAVRARVWLGAGLFLDVPLSVAAARWLRWEVATPQGAPLLEVP